MSFKHYLTEQPSPGPLFISFTATEGEDAEGYLKKKIKSAKFVPWSGVTLINDDLEVDGVSIKRCPFVMLGAMGKSESYEIGATVKAYLDEHKVPYLLYGQTPEADSKVKATLTLALRKVPQVKTIIGTGNSLTSAQLVKQLKLPLVSKIINGSKGKGVKKHDDEASLKKMLDADPALPHIFQEFVPNDGDYRVFFIKQKLIYILKRTRVKDKFRNNTSLGGKCELMDSLPPEAMKVAVAAVKAMKYDISGVDLIQHQETKKWYVMEVNAAPQFGGDELQNVLDEIIKLI